LWVLLVKVILQQVRWVRDMEHVPLRLGRTSVERVLAPCFQRCSALSKERLCVGDKERSAEKTEGGVQRVGVVLRLATNAACERVLALRKEKQEAEGINKTGCRRTARNKERGMG
jgi:hypothetical protein